MQTNGWTNIKALEEYDGRTYSGTDRVGTDIWTDIKMFVIAQVFIRNSLKITFFYKKLLIS